MSTTSLIVEAPDAFMPPNAAIQWRHADVLGEVRGDFALRAMNAKTAREREFYQYTERTLEEVLLYLWKVLGNSRYQVASGEPVSGSGYPLIDEVVSCVARAERDDLSPSDTKTALLAAESAINALAGHLSALSVPDSPQSGQVVVRDQFGNAVFRSQIIPGEIK